MIFSKFEIFIENDSYQTCSSIQGTRITAESVSIMHQSIPSANIPPGQIFEVGKTFLQNHDPRVKKTPTPGEDFETDLVSFFC